MSRQMMLTVAFSAAAAALATLAVLRLAPQTPASAVVAFAAADSCPQGWQDYTEANGRVIIGAGRGAGLTLREFGTVGGRENPNWKDIGLQETLINQMISRSGGGMSVFNPGAIPITTRVLGAVKIFDGEQKDFGELATLPPYIALKLCRKI